MDDNINRKAAIAELDHGVWGKEYDKALAKAMLESLPTAQQWIPCSERLPEKPCYCLTSNEYSNVCEDFYWGKDSFEKANKYHYEVLAWMPLPEPYKGGETE